MAIHFGALPGVLFSPTKTFEDLKKDVNLLDGIKLYFIMAVIGLLVDIIFSVGVLSSIKVPFTGQSVMNTGSVLLVILAAIGEMLLYFGMFLLISWLITKMTGALSNKGADFGKIAGMLSYTGAAFYIFVGLPLGIIVMLLMLATGSFTVGMNPMAGAGMFVGIMVMGLISLLVAIWEWMIAGKAVSIVSDTSWGTGIASVLLGFIILVLIAFVVGLVLGLAFFSMMGMSTMGSYSPTGLSVAGL
jgi:hypothetical protein